MSDIKTLLIVDPDACLRNIIKSFLSDKNIRVLEASDFTFAKDVLNSENVDLCIFDVDEPIHYDISSIKEIKDKFSGIKFLITSVNTLNLDINYIKNELKCNEKDIKLKPFSFVDLSRYVEENI